MTHLHLRRLLDTAVEWYVCVVVDSDGQDTYMNGLSVKQSKLALRRRLFLIE